MLPPAEVGGHHAVHVDAVTQLYGYGHGEPAGAQPGVGPFPRRQEWSAFARQKYTETHWSDKITWEKPNV